LGEGDDDHAQFRVVTGYDSLLNVIRAGFAPERVELRTSTIVTRIAWRRGEVEVIARPHAGSETSHRARAAVATLPLGVLRAEARRRRPRVAVEDVRSAGRPRRRSPQRLVDQRLAERSFLARRVQLHTRRRDERAEEAGHAGGADDLLRRRGLRRGAVRNRR